MNSDKAWAFAIGLVKGSGLEPTDDFIEYIEQEKHGGLTDEEIKTYLNKKYKKEQ